MTEKKTPEARARKANAKAAGEQKADSAKTVGVDVSAGELNKARKEGALQAEREAAADSYTYATDGNLPADPDNSPRQFPGHDEIMQYAPLLGLGIEAFEEAIDEKAEPALPDSKVYGLLGLERNGQNRTPYVQAMVKRLDLKPGELPGGGPGYTNDVHPTSELFASKK